MRAFLVFAAFAALLALTWTQVAAADSEQDNVEALFDVNENQGHENESDREARQVRHAHGIGGGFGRGIGGGHGQGRGIGGGFGQGGFGRGISGGYGGGIGVGFGGGLGGGLGGGHGQGGFKRGGYHG